MTIHTLFLTIMYGQYWACSEKHNHFTLKTLIVVNFDRSI
uniref:Uncharacterized protein n=1 Tax=Arundo donax TaxID=35708 RepID=A0A0A8ZQA9_ARUDO